MTQGHKYDGNKPQFRLVPPKALQEVAEVLTFGAKKYSPDNWKYVDKATERYLDATLRHINAVQRGEVLDPESGNHHYAHAVCSLLFLLELWHEEQEKKQKKDSTIPMLDELLNSWLMEEQKKKPAKS